MKPFLNRKLVAGATGLVLLAGGAGALAASQLASTSGKQAYIDDVATHLGVSPSALTSAMKAAAIDQINAAASAGRLTQTQANALRQRIRSGDGLPLIGHRFGHGGLHSGVSAAAQYLGISETTLLRDLRSGKSLAQITSSTRGKSVAELKASIIAAETKRLNNAVSKGRITSQEKQQRLSELSSRIDSLLNRTWTSGSGAGAGFGWHH